jgi:uncharacterized membrane protein
METIQSFLATYWLALTCLIVAVGLGVMVLLHWLRHGILSWRCYSPAVALASYGIGAFNWFPTWWVGLTIAASALGIFVFLLVLVVLKGSWSALAGYGLTVLFFFGLGDWSGSAVAEFLHDALTLILSLRPLEPWWLLLLLVIPVLLWTSYGNLITLGTTRRWIVLGLRCALIALLALALSEVYARRPNENVTVMFVWERSLSMPPEFEGGTDQRQARIYRFINDAVALRGSAHANDKVGVIVFGKHPSLELPPGRVPKLNFTKIYSPIDNSYTDVASALKLALASFPEGMGKRIVLISDGNENIGDALEQARIAKQNGVQIDIVPIAAGRKHQNEILVERIEAPSLAEKGSRLPMRVVIRSFHPEIVEARLSLRKVTFDPSQDGKQPDETSTIVELRQGLQAFQFQQAGAKDDTVFAYEASIVPLRVKTEAGAIRHKGLPGDRVDNNVARVTVMSRGERAVLILEDRPEGKLDQVTHQLLVDRLKAANPQLKVAVMTTPQLRTLTRGENERLATLLSRFDAVFLANIPADQLSEDEQKVMRSYVYDQGMGLVMIGGHQSFGAGGWQNTEIEKALPVEMDLKSIKVEGRSGLVLIMHASEMAEGNAWQRKIAKLALEKLSPMDWFGQIHYSHGAPGGHQWHIPFQEIAGNRANLMRKVDSMEPGDMPDVDPAFMKAYKELSNPEYALGTKHIILISDGDHWDASRQMLMKLRSAKITCTGVCITTHGADAYKKLADVARATGGRSYDVKDPKELPAIYVKETRLVSQSFVHDKPFLPLLKGPSEGPTEGMAGALPKLFGFVRTTKRESPLVKVMVETEQLGQFKFPIVAAWQYGLGKSIAFTSDARTQPDGAVFWDRDWANDKSMYGRFWNQTLDYVLRPKETGTNLFLTTEQKDGKIRVIVEARDTDKMPLTNVKLKAGITSPAFKVNDDRRTELRFEQKNVGVYEAEFPADEVGAYFITIQGSWKKDGKEMFDQVRAGVTIPYSPEFAEMESNPSLLDKLREMTDGKAYRDDDAVLAKAAASAEVFRTPLHTHGSPQALWPWLVFATGLCLLLDVAVRRIAIQPEAVWAKSVALWQRLRGQAITAETPEYIERLRSRKARVSETMDKQKAAAKFDAGDFTSKIEAPTIASPTAEPAKPTPPKAPAKKEQEEADFASRLMRAKKKAMEDREKK